MSSELTQGPASSPTKEERREGRARTLDGAGAKGCIVKEGRRSRGCGDSSRDRVSL